MRNHFLYLVPLDMLLTDRSAVSAAASGRVQNYTAVSLEALVIYEYLITIADEVRCVWQKKRFTATSLLLLATRWTVVTSAILMTLPPTPKEYVAQHPNSPNTLTSQVPSCAPLSIASVPLLLLGFIQLGLFSALRVYAIWNRSLRWALVVFVLELVPVATNVYAAIATEYTYIPWPLSACTKIPRYSARQGELLTYTTRGCLLVSHTIVLVITWLKTYSQWLEARRCKLSVSVSTCLLRDGTWFFLATLALNVAQIVASSTPNFPVDLFVTTLPALLFNRFMLNLRSVDDDAGAAQSTAAAPRLSRFSSARFRIPESFLGNIGGPVEAGDSGELGDDAEVAHSGEHWADQGRNEAAGEP